MKLLIILTILTQSLIFASSQIPLGSISKVDLILPIQNIDIKTFLNHSISYRPENIIKDGLPHFGAKRDDFKGKNRKHKGYDIYLNHVNIIASADGFVKNIAKGRRSGLYIKLQHKNHIETLYIHLSKAYVKKNQIVKRGEIIGRIDKATGNAIEPQLHYEIKKSRVHQDPLKLIQKEYRDNIEIINIIDQSLIKLQKSIKLRNKAIKKYRLKYSL
jgi:murein DD-endopeptidase MepM/ murein hydrolase activator NlpD